LAASTPLISPAELLEIVSCQPATVALLRELGATD
jgi:hypothetical protein